jgi:hypothetical protein
MMNTTERFHALNLEQRLAVAAMAARRVLPIFRYVFERPTEVFEDGLRLVWLEIEGRAVTHQDYARVMNAAIETIPRSEKDDPNATAALHAGRATVNVLEGAQHNPDALAEGLDHAVHAVEAFAGDDAARTEREWQRWAIDRAALLERPQRDAFTSRDAPTAAWLDELGAHDLPLLRGPTR